MLVLVFEFNFDVDFYKVSFLSGLVHRLLIVMITFKKMFFLTFSHTPLGFCDLSSKTIKRNALLEK